MKPVDNRGKVGAFPVRLGPCRSGAPPWSGLGLAFKPSTMNRA